MSTLSSSLCPRNLDDSPWENAVLPTLVEWIQRRYHCGQRGQTRRDVRLHRFCQLNPPFRDHNFLLRSFELPILPQISKKNERSIQPKCKRKENTTVLNKQETHYPHIQILAELSTESFETLLSLKKKHRRSNAIVERGPFFRVLSFSVPHCNYTKTIAVSALCEFCTLQLIRVSDPWTHKMGLIWRAMTKTRFEKQPA